MHDGRLYVVRPRPGGTTLADRLAEGPLDPSETVRLLSEVAGALGSARALGLPVDGLTPQDVLLTGTPASALLTRYGLGPSGARACERPVGLEDAGYLAPEAACGAPVEPASTVYALACVLVACLTGAPPFAHERPLLTLHAHLTAAPPAVSSRDRGLPREIDEVVAAALAKAPADRPRSPERLMRAVQRALATSAPIPVAAPPARPRGQGAAPDAQTPARARPERKRRPRDAAPRRRRRARVPSWRAALVGAASLVVLSAGFGAGTLAGDVRAAGPGAASGPTVAQRTAAVQRLDLAMARLSTRRTLARARLRRARDARAEAAQATALAGAIAGARRVADADATAAGAAPVAATSRGGARLSPPRRRGDPARPPWVRRRRPRGRGGRAHPRRRDRAEPLVVTACATTPGGTGPLRPEQVDLADLALALEDHSDEHVWLLDAATGTVEARFRSPVAGTSAGADAVVVEPLPAAIAYADMEDFAAHVRDVRARDLLERAIVGRGAFRRFKDTLIEMPDLRRAWFAFHDARSERRALEWLVEHDLVEPGAAAEAIAARGDPDPDDLPGLIDAQGLAHRVAHDLRRVYRKRLRTVLLVGAWARGDAHPEAPVELVVVLDRFADRWAEKRRMDRILWRHSIRNDAVVTAAPVAQADFERAEAPHLMAALEEGVRVA